MDIKKTVINLAAALCAALMLMIAVWGPEAWANYNDKNTLNHISAEPVEKDSEGYVYTLTGNEKLYLLAKCLNSQSLPESELSSLTRRKTEVPGYEELTGTYAFVVNRQGPSDWEITQEEVYEVCNRELKTMRELGILPDEVKEITASAYNAVFYSAIDVLDPRNNVSVWKVSLSTDKRNADKSGRLLDAYIDASTGKMYEFYVRTSTVWNEMEPDAMMTAWGEYLELTGQEAYDMENPLAETTPYFKKYCFSGMNEGSTVVTIGFYEGINELFLKISR